MAVTQSIGLTLKCIKINRIYSKLATKDNNILEIVKAALAKVESLTLIESPGFLGFISSVPLPSLRRLKLAKYWLIGFNLRKFLKA